MSKYLLTVSLEYWNRCITDWFRTLYPIMYKSTPNISTTHVLLLILLLISLCSTMQSPMHKVNIVKSDDFQMKSWNINALSFFSPFSFFWALHKIKISLVELKLICTKKSGLEVKRIVSVPIDWIIWNLQTSTRKSKINEKKIIQAENEKAFSFCQYTTKMKWMKK